MFLEVLQIAAAAPWPEPCVGVVAAEGTEEIPRGGRGGTTSPPHSLVLV